VDKPLTKKRKNGSDRKEKKKLRNTCALWHQPMRERRAWDRYNFILIGT